MIAKPTFTLATIAEHGSLSTILHRIGHDIGNPLTSVISLASIVEMTDDLGKIKGYAKSISVEAWRVFDIVEKMVLIFSNKETTKTELSPAKILQQVFQKCQRPLEFKRFDLNVKSDANILLSTNQEQFEWLIGALFSNALKSLSNEKTIDEQFDSIFVAIANNGEAVTIEITNFRSTPSSLPLGDLFNPFIKEDDTSTLAGLGLTASAMVVERLGGEIELEQEKVDNDKYKFTARIRLKS